MFKVIFKAEIKHIFSQPLFYLLLIGTLLLSYILFIGNSGFFDGHGEGLQRWVNSPYELHLTGIYLTKLLVFYIPIFVGGALYRDYTENAHSIPYSYPIEKSDLYLGKFFAGFSAVAVIAIFSGLVPLWAVHTPGLDPGKIGPTLWLPVLRCFVLYTLPTLILASGIVFAVVSMTRNIYSGFIAILLLFLFQVFSENSLSSGSTIALLDPFAQNTISFLTKDWTIIERNEILLPIIGLMLLNRLGVLIIGVLSLLLGSKLFELHEFPKNISWYKRRAKHQKRPAFKSVSAYTRDDIHFNTSLQHQLRIAWSTAKMDIIYILKNRIFLIMTLLGILSLVFMTLKLTDKGDMIILPVTHMIISVPAFFYGMTILILTFILSGMVYQRAQNAQMDALIDSTPISNASLFGGKVLSLWIVQLILLSLLMIVGVGIQVYHGYYSFELPLYLFHILCVLFPGLGLWAVISIAVQHFSGRPFLGIIILLAMWVGVNGMSQIGIDSALLTFNQDEPISYSQVNGYGDALYAFYLVKVYWICVVILITTIALWTWRRGYLKQLWNLNMLSQMRPRNMIAPAILLIGLIASASMIWKEEQKTFSATFPKPSQYFKEASIKIAPYLPSHSLKIVQIKMTMDIYPRQRSFKAEGRYSIINPHDEEVDTLVLRYGFDEITATTINNSLPIYSDSLLQWKVYQLNSPVRPGDTLFLDFSVESKSNTAFERKSSVLSNGTFIKSDILPRLGIPKAASNNHSHGHYQGSDSDLLDYECIISTSEDQIPITQGKRIRSWDASGRTVAHYKTQKGIKFGFSFHSGQFEHLSKGENDLTIHAYYIKEHEDQIHVMVDGIYSAIQYNSAQFSPYEHDQVTLVEFPNSEGSYATAFGNVLPVSEVRFIVDNSRSEKGINLGFYVPAHEVTHHWWGNQLMPADAPGAHMLTESITEYCTYQVYKQKYGKDRALDFIKLQHRRYFEGRRKARKTEPSLALVGEDQTYVSYGKGAIAFRSLAHSWGEDEMNASLRAFLEKYKYSGDPYPTTKNLECAWYDHLPDSLLPMMDYLLNATAVLDLSIENARRLDQNKAVLDISVSGLRDFGGLLWVDIGLYDGKIKVDQKRIKVRIGQTSYEIKIPESKVEIVVDPDYFLLDKNRTNNMRRI